MPLGDYLAGLAVFAAVAGCAAGAAALCLRGRAIGVAGPPRVLAWSLLFLAALLAVHLVPGILGVLGRGSVLVVAAALLVFAWALRVAPAQAGPPPDRASNGSGRADWVAAAVAAAVVGWLVLAALIERAPVAVTNLDALNFHLPGIANWIQHEGFWQIGQWVPDLAHGNYPQNGDLLDLSVVMPWHNDAFVRLVGVPLLALAALSVYAIGVELGAPRASSALWAAAFAAMPAVVQPAALEVLTDDLLLASLGIGTLFLLRHARTAERADLVLAGLGLGIAFGTKWYGVSSVAVIVAVWLGASLLGRVPPRVAGKRLVALACLIAAAGGFWLLRNWVESGNPVFPVRVEPLGVTIFDAPFDDARARVGFTVASYLDDPGVLGDYIVPALEKTVALPGLLIGVAVVATLIIATRRPGAARQDPRVPAIAIASLLLAVAYAVTPYSALGLEGKPLFTEFNVRYLAPALLAGAPLAARLPVALPAVHWVWTGLGVVAAAQAARFTADEIGTTPLVQAGLGVAVLAAAVAAFALLGDRARPRRAPRPAVAATVAVALAVAAAGGQALQTRFNDSRYTGVDSAFDWASRHSGLKVGLVGNPGVSRESPVWPMFGPRLGNEVIYVGPFRDAMLRDYGSRAGLLGGVRESGVDYLLVARGEPPRDEVAQERWATAAGFRRVLRSGRFTLFRAGPAPAADGR
ncbi:MAG TPA: phospholipid carrier-dependent glycosyltransferase [Solirubrobacterales bacterium]|nr:phospholipid carrier-dependent glycosyltransferase [Solirubrobacterales bacterium]